MNQRVGSAAGSRRSAGPAARRLTFPAWLQRRWVTVLPLACMIVSDYKLRVRADVSSLAGSLDVFIVVELAVYGLVAGFLLLVVAAHAPRLPRPPALLFWMWAYALVLAGSAAYALYPKLALARGIQLLIVCGLGHAIYSHATPRQINHLAHAFVVLVTASALVGVAYRFPQPQGQREGFNWLFVHPVNAGTYLAISVVLLAGYLRWPRMRKQGLNWRPATYGLLFGLNVVALLATRTRGAAGGALVGLLVVALLSTGRRRKQTVLLVMSAVVVAVVLAGTGPIVSFLERGATTEELTTLTSRTRLWDEALELASERPVFGYGLGATRGLFLDTIGLGGGHNGFVNVLIDGGLVGVAVWVALLASVLGGAFERRRRDGFMTPEAVLIVGVFAMLLMNSMTTEGLGGPANVSNVWLFVLCGWVGALRRNREVPASSMP